MHCCSPDQHAHDAYQNSCLGLQVAEVTVKLFRIQLLMHTEVQKEQTQSGCVLLCAGSGVPDQIKSSSIDMISTVHPLTGRSVSSPRPSGILWPFSVFLHGPSPDDAQHAGCYGSRFKRCCRSSNTKDDKCAKDPREPCRCHNCPAGCMQGLQASMDAQKPGIHAQNMQS